jgi:IS5 family transposase
MDIMNYGVSEKYKEYVKYGDSLHEMGEKIDWDSLRPIFRDLYVNDTVNGGRPNIDPIIMVKALFIQSIYNLVDEQVEKEMHDRISMMHFLGFPDTIPDSRTIWLFRERLSTTGKDRIMWKEIWKQFEDRGIIIKKGTVQDATFIESDPGKHGKKKPPVPPDPSILPIKENILDPTMPKKITKEEKKQAKTKAAEKKRERRTERKQGKTRRSKDGTWTKKNSVSHFGNKLHTVQGTDIPLIREFVVTTASLHDSQIDLGIPGIPNYRDKGYYGSNTRGIDATMDKASRNHPLNMDQIRRNRRITKKRSPGERPYSVMKNIFHGGHVFVTMIRRTRVKAAFMCLGYNLLTLVSLEKNGKVAAAIKK